MRVGSGSTLQGGCPFSVTEKPFPSSTSQEHVPPRLCTSPIPWGGLSGFPSDSQVGTASEPEAIMGGTASTGRKKRRRRRKPRRKEEAIATDSSSEELEAGTETELSPLEKPVTPGYVGPNLDPSAVSSACFLPEGLHPMV